MHKLAALAIVLVPLAAYADDEAVPVDAVPSIETTPVVEPVEPVVEATVSASAEVTVEAAPVEAVTPSEVAPVAPVATHRSWCDHVDWGRTDPWEHSMWF